MGLQTYRNLWDVTEELWGVIRKLWDVNILYEIQQLINTEQFSINSGTHYTVEQKYIQIIAKDPCCALLISLAPQPTADKFSGELWEL